jgi:hypothetical protein
MNSSFSTTTTSTTTMRAAAASRDDHDEGLVPLVTLNFRHAGPPARSRSADSLSTLIAAARGSFQ